jgi:hypothetical protein
MKFGIGPPALSRAERGCAFEETARNTSQAVTLSSWPTFCSIGGYEAVH